MMVRRSRPRVVTAVSQFHLPARAVTMTITANQPIHGVPMTGSQKNQRTTSHEVMGVSMSTTGMVRITCQTMRSQS